MFENILQMVKDHFSNHPALTALPADQQDAIHNEIANHISNNLNTQQATTQQAIAPQPGSGGILNTLENAIASGGTVTSAIEGGLVSSLTSKLGLPPSITGAIAGALPGLLQKFVGGAKSTGV
jgi:hypothetical protein